MISDKREIREYVKDRYGRLAQSINSTEDCGCSPQNTTGCCSPEITNLEELSVMLGYNSEDLNNVPELSNLGLGCGNPQAIANIKAGESVLDLGSGAGFDVFLASRQVGEHGKVIGVDMTSEMVEKAKRNAFEGNYTNVEFRLGEIENLPVEDNSIDVIISNCVINLSPEKGKVFNEAYRVLKKGGRIAISDIVSKIKFPSVLQNNMEYFSGCITGASLKEDLEYMLKEAGFTDIRINPKYELDKIVKSWAPGTRISDYIFSATIEAVKP